MALTGYKGRPRSDNPARARESGRRAARAGCAAGFPGSRRAGGVRSITSQSWISPSTSCSSWAALRAASASGPRHGPVDLEHVAQPLGGDPQVVLGAPRRRIERRIGERKHLSGPDPDDALGVDPQRRRRVEALDLARLHVFAAFASFFSRRRSLRSRFLARYGANSSFACALLGAQRHDPRRQRLAIGLRSLLREPGEELELDVAVAALAERVGQSLHPLQRLAMALPGKAGLEDLQRRPQPPRRHPHVVQAVDVLDVEHALGVREDLGRPDPHNPRGGSGERLVAIEARDLTRARHERRLTGGARPAPKVGPRRRGEPARSRWRRR